MVTSYIRSFKSHLHEGKTSSDIKLKVKIAKMGQKHHLDKLVDDPSAQVRLSVAKRGFPDHLEKYVDDPNYNVRREVAINGSLHQRMKLADKEDHPEVVAKLIWHKDSKSVPTVMKRLSVNPNLPRSEKMNLATWASIWSKSLSGEINTRYKPTLDILSNDRSHEVRGKVAEQSPFKEHQDKLINDHDKYVRHCAAAAIARAGYKDHLDKLVDHPEPYVRHLVARYAPYEYASKLVNDPESSVREQARYNRRLHQNK